MAKEHEIDIQLFDNCMQDPQAILSKALQNKNIQDFRIALEMDADPTRMDENTYTSVFEKALQTYGCAEFVEECLRRGCKCDYLNTRLNKTPINFATDSHDPNIIKLLLKCKKNLQIDRKYANLTPLNSLTKSLTNDNYENIYDCIKLLIEYGANPNIPDHKEMTPILYILNNRKLNNDYKKNLIEYLLNNSYNYDIDLDTYRDGEARERLKLYFPEIQYINLNDNNININNITYDLLLSLIRNCNEDKFIRLFLELEQEHHHHQQENTSSSPTSSSTVTIENNNEKQNNKINEILTKENYTQLLFETIKKYLYNSTELLIKSNNIDINLIINNNSAIEIACIYGNWKILQLLLNMKNLKLRKYENLLIKIIKNLDNNNNNQNNLNNKDNDNCNYLKCFYILCNSNRININEYDKSDTTALHYAVKYKNDKIINELLKYGAYIGKKSKFNDLPINDINPELLENYFDQCIQTNNLKTGDNNYEIIINYTNLIPPSSSLSSTSIINNNDNNDTKLSLQNINQINEEILPIEYISNTKELCHLLKHPLITSFLYLKWHRLSIIFYINFIIYTLFCISLITYILLYFNNIINYDILFIFKMISIIGLLYMIIRELIQFFISPNIFIKSLINYIEIILIILIIIQLCEPNYEKEKQRVLAVFTILLLSIELCLLIGSLPILSISTHMLMLKAVTTSFLKSFTLYSIFIITFSLCFYILFGKTPTTSTTSTTSTTTTINDNNKANNNNDDNGDDGDGEFNKFVNPFLAIIKTIVMLTGEFDAGDINFSSLTSYLVFLLFVFFMSIVLFNLLNGLAVSDTQAIKSQAELNGSICRTNLLASYEKCLIGNNRKTNILINYQPFRSILKRLTNLFPNFINGNYISILPNDNNKILIPNTKTIINNDILLKIKNNDDDNNCNDKFLNKNNLLFNKNDVIEQQKKQLNGPIKYLPCCCICINGNCTQMDKKTVKQALIIIEKNQLKLKEKQKLEENEKRLKTIENKIDKIFEFLQDIVMK